MQTFAYCFVVLFAGALALPKFVDDVEYNFEDKIPRSDVEDKIVGGHETTIEKHPHQLSLRASGRHYCGGSLLSATRALTAGHCVRLNEQPSRYSIMAGSTMRLGDDNAQLRTLNRFIRHPEFHSNRFRVINDVALLYWDEPLTLGATVRAIALPPQDSPVPNGVNCTVSGWGTTTEGGSIANHLKVVTKPIVGNEDCNRSYLGIITPDMLCAGLPGGGRDACQGDSGGPLVIDNMVVGVVSWGKGCARPRFPGVYARVPFFTNWIRENM